jgi:hypothetical protein
MPPPVPPPGTQWQLVTVGTTAKPDEPEKGFTFGPGGPLWMPPPGTRWQLVEDKTPAEKKEMQVSVLSIRCKTSLFFKTTLFGHFKI